MHDRDILYNGSKVLREIINYIDDPNVDNATFVQILVDNELLLRDLVELTQRQERAYNR